MGLAVVLEALVVLAWVVLAWVMLVVMLAAVVFVSFAALQVLADNQASATKVTVK